MRTQKKFPWGEKREWEFRTKVIAQIIPARMNILELGGGYCHLKKYLKECTYTSIDIEKWTDKTIQANFNKGEFPDIGKKFDFIVCAGILEYIREPEKFLQAIHKYSDRLILTYREGKQDTEVWRNELTLLDIIKLVDEKNGWHHLMAKHLQGREILHYCIKQ